MSPTLVRLVLDLALVVDVSEEGVVGKVGLHVSYYTVIGRVYMIVHRS